MADEKEVRLLRVFDAPRHIVYQYWSDPRKLAQWWGPYGFTNPRCELDAKPGGAIRIDMRGPDGKVYPMGGEFKEVKEGKSLVFTSTAFDDANNPSLENLNTITFEADGDKTRLTVHAKVLRVSPEMEAAVEGMAEGWSMSLDKLAKLVAKDTGKKPIGMTLIFTSNKSFKFYRYLDASMQSVFDAYTKPEHIVTWWGPHGYTMPVCEVDLQVGGQYRFMQRGPDGKKYPFKGTYLEIVQPRKLAFTQFFDEPPHDKSEVRISADLSEQDGKTRVEASIAWPTKEELDTNLLGGMIEGVGETYERLEEHLAKLQSKQASAKGKEPGVA